MIPGRREGLGQVMEDTQIVVSDMRGLSVLDLASVLYLPYSSAFRPLYE